MGKKDHQREKHFEIDPETHVDVARVRMTPAGEMDSANAAKYLDRTPQTLAHWRVAQRGPKYVKRDGRIIYTKPWLDAYRAAAK